MHDGSLAQFYGFVVPESECNEPGLTDLKYLTFLSVEIKLDTQYLVLSVTITYQVTRNVVRSEKYGSNHNL